METGLRHVLMTSFQTDALGKYSRIILLFFWLVSQKITDHFICKVKCKFHRNGSERC